MDFTKWGCKNGLKKWGKKEHQKNYVYKLKIKNGISKNQKAKNEKSKIDKMTKTKSKILLAKM